MKTKTAVRYYTLHTTHLLECLNLKSLTVPRVSDDEGKPELTYTADGNVKLYNCLGKCLPEFVFLNLKHTYLMAQPFRSTQEK